MIDDVATLRALQAEVVRLRKQVLALEKERDDLQETLDRLRLQNLNEESK